MSGHENLREGVLYIVSTPIGNLEDITYRAVRILEEVDFIAAEDTRKTSILLNRYGIKKKCISFNAYNHKKKIPFLIRRLKSGESAAVVSDAGTPGINDPCYNLVIELIKENLVIEQIPGCTSFVPALILSGFPTNRFIFEGFLPVKKGRQKRIEFLKDEHRTIILFESPYRVEKTLKELKEHLGNRRISVSRELTKKFEETIRTDLERAINTFTGKKPKGEFVLVIEGKRKNGEKCKEGRCTNNLTS